MALCIIQNLQHNFWTWVWPRPRLKNVKKTALFLYEGFPNRWLLITFKIKAGYFGPNLTLGQKTNKIWFDSESIRSSVKTTWNNLILIQMCNFREKFWKIRCYQFGGKGSRKQSSPMQEKLKRSCRIKGIVIAHLADQSLWQDGNFDYLFMHFYALKFCKNLAEKVAQKSATGNFDFLFSSYSGNFVSKSSSSSIWTLILDQWINY